MAVFEDIVIRVTSQGVKEVAGGLGAIGKEAEKTTGALAALNRIAYTLAGAFSIKQLAAYADEYTNLTNQLKLVTKTSAELAATQDRLFKIAQESRSNVKDLTNLYVSLNLAQKETGVSGEKLFRVVGTISKSLAISGASASSASNALRQLVQGLQSGRLGGEELKSVLENTRYTAIALAKGLGVPIGQLRKMGEEGKLTSRAVAEAFLRVEKDVDKAFGKTSITISQALQLIDNAFMRFIGTTGETSGAIGLIAKSLALLAQYLPEVIISIAALTAVWVAYRVAVIAVAAAQWLANAAMLASPLGLVIATIGIVIALMVTYTASVKGIVPMLKDWWETAKGLYKYLADGIKGVGEIYTAISNVISQTVTGWGKSISQFIEDTKTWFADWYNYIVDFFIVKIPNTVKSGLESVKQFFVDIWTGIKDFVTGVANSIVESVQSMVSRAKSLLQQILSFVGQGQTAVQQLNSLNESSNSSPQRAPITTKTNQGDVYKPDTMNSPNETYRPNTQNKNQDLFTPDSTYQKDFMNTPETTFSNVAKTIGDLLTNPNPRDTSNIKQRASGGPVTANKNYLVGEDGPELFVPKSSGSIVSNGKSKSMLGGGDGSAVSPSRSIEMIAQGVAMGNIKLEEIADKTYKLLQGGSSSGGSSSTRSSGGSSSNDNGDLTPGMSAINNFGSVSPASSPPPSGSGGGHQAFLPSMSGGAAGQAAVSLGEDISSWTTKLRKAFEDNDRQLFLKDPSYKTADKANARLAAFIATIPSSIADEVKKRASLAHYGPATQANVNFRSGGAFSVSGGTGVDSKVVPMRVSPGERVDVRTRKQVRDEQAGNRGGDTYQISVTIATPDANSFAKSEKQVKQQLLRSLIKEAS